jgi:hypothetical protein
MTAELYSGARPGRPTLLLLLTAAALVGSLGFALVQVRQARALGPPQHVRDTPISVRLPPDWRANPKDVREFFLPAGGGQGRQLDVQRIIRFEFVRLSAFRPVAELAKDPRIMGSCRVLEQLPARIGEYPALEVRALVSTSFGPQARLTRLTTLPRGELLVIHYYALLERRPADDEIFDEVCRSVTLNDPTLSATPAEYLARAGLKLPLEPAWMVVGSDFPEVPGVFVAGTADGAPAWSIAIYRTWLSGGRTPRDLLTDLATEQWLDWAPSERIVEITRPDGVRIASLRGGSDALPLRGAYVVSASPTDTALFLVHVGAAREPAFRAAEQIAAGFEFAASPSLPDVAECEVAGVALARDLRKGGPGPRWGREPTKAQYVLAGQQDDLILVERGARNRNPALGFAGSISERRGRVEALRAHWTLDAAAITYRTEMQMALPEQGVEVYAEEERSGSDAPITRRLRADQRDPLRWTFMPSERFVPWPALDIVQAWVANGHVEGPRGRIEAALIETTSSFGPRGCFELLRRLPQDREYPRVLVQRDYWPVGEIVAFDEGDAIEQYWTRPGVEFRRAR